MKLQMVFKFAVLSRVWELEENNVSSWRQFFAQFSFTIHWNGCWWERNYTHNNVQGIQNYFAREASTFEVRLEFVSIQSWALSGRTSMFHIDVNSLVDTLGVVRWISRIPHLCPSFDPITSQFTSHARAYDHWAWSTLDIKTYYGLARSSCFLAHRSSLRETCNLAPRVITVFYKRAICISIY